MTTDVLETPTVSCTSCAAKIEGHLGRLDGIESTTVDPDQKRVSVSYDDTTIGRSRIIAELEELGYPATAAEA